MGELVLTKEEIRQHEQRCREYRQDIRRKLQRAGYGAMTLEEAERIARRLTVRH